MYDYSFVIFVFVFIFLSCDQVDILCIHRCATEIFSPSQLSHLPFIYVTCILQEGAKNCQNYHNYKTKCTWHVGPTYGPVQYGATSWLGGSVDSRIWFPWNSMPHENMLLAILGWEGDENRRRNTGEGETYI